MEILPFISGKNLLRGADFYTYWTKYVPYRNYAATSSVYDYARVGDIVQLREASSGRRYHSTIITRRANNTVYLTYNSVNRTDVNINSISSGNNWSVLKFVGS